MTQDFRNLDTWKTSRLLLLVLHNFSENFTGKHPHKSLTRIKPISISFLAALYRAFTAQNYKNVYRYSEQALDYIVYLEKIFKSRPAKRIVNENTRLLVLNLTEKIKTGIYQLRENSFQNHRYCFKTKNMKQRMLRCH